MDHKTSAKRLTPSVELDRWPTAARRSRSNTGTVIFFAIVVGLGACALAWHSVSMAAEVEPKKYSLIVGVNNYENLRQQFQLKGPANDAVLVSRVLQKSGFSPENIDLLADGTPGAQRPTRDAIDTSFRKLISKVDRGDFVHLHFSGHGSQQPVQADRGRASSLETDGFDEIFLPSDVGHWNGSKGFVENAIVDDEIADWVTQLRNKGAFVFAVFDSCHSGTMLRSAPVADEVERRVEFLELVRPADRESVSGNAGSMPHGIDAAIEANPKKLRPDAGDFVAFYASQTNETTPELRQPVGEMPRQTHGLFTFALMRAIEARPGISYRQAAQQVLQNYDTMHRSRPTPLFEGTALDAPVFGLGRQHRIAQWPLKIAGDTIYIDAGTLQEVGIGTVMSLVPTPTSPDFEAIATVEVASADLLHSQLRVVGETDGIDLVSGSPYARLVTRVVDLTLTVAKPELSALNNSIIESVQTGLDLLTKSEDTLLEWVDPGETADVRLTVSGNRIWLLPPSGETLAATETETPSIGIDTDDLMWTGGLRDSLHRIARAINLMRLALTSDSTERSLDIIMEAKRAEDSTFSNVDRLDRTAFSDGDTLRWELRNVANRPIDVTMLFVDNRWGIEAIYPYELGASNRIEVGGRDYVEGVVNSSDTTGVERIIVIAVPAVPNAPRSDFTFLAQRNIPVMRGGGQSNSNLYELLAKAGFVGGRVRGFDRREAIGATMAVLTWKTQ